MSEEQKKLEKILLDKIEKETKEPSIENNLIGIAGMAQQLIELWKITD